MSSQATVWDPRLIDFLAANDADQTGHSGRTLLDHLVGTADRLRDWGNPPAICHAGLFHSVYGTQSFKIQSVALERRAEVAALIGEEAEALAWIFCVCDRRGFRVADTGDATTVQQHATGEQLQLAATVVTQLLEIEVANLLDQIPPRSEAGERIEGYMVAFAETAGGRVSDGARTALGIWLGQ